jgi:hypothetical protein
MIFETVVASLILALFVFIYLMGRRDGYREGMVDGVDEGKQIVLKENIARAEALHRSLSVDMERALTQYEGSTL